MMQNSKKKNFIGLPTTFSYLCVSIQADMKKESQVIFDKNVIEFVTVAAEFCAFLERAESMKRSTFVDTTLKILPLLYLKASMLPKCEMIGDESPETYVTEEIYEVLRINLASILVEKDDYLEVFLPDMLTVTNRSKRIFRKIWPISIRISKTLSSYSSWD